MNEGKKGGRKQEGRKNERNEGYWKNIGLKPVFELGCPRLPLTKDYLTGHDFPTFATGHWNCMSIPRRQKLVITHMQ